ncbi:MAG TPA: type II toxin-antitoxin system VapC family toxin [Vicinamibacterales bacterium]
MKILLDTQCWLWMTTSPERFSPTALEQIETTENELFFSAVSAWEIALKVGLGKLRLPERPRDYIARHLRQTRTMAMPITVEHGAYVAELPAHHRDPFDRLLIAQAIAEDMPILTVDPQFQKYDVRLIA